MPPSRRRREPPRLGCAVLKLQHAILKLQTAISKLRNAADLSHCAGAIRELTQHRDEEHLVHGGRADR
jgi:hypothetical protein